MPLQKETLSLNISSIVVLLFPFLLSQKLRIAATTLFLQVQHSIIYDTWHSLREASISLYKECRDFTILDCAARGIGCPIEQH